MISFPQEPIRRTASLLLCILLGALAFYAFFAWIFPLLLPFLTAFAVAALLRRPAAALARVTKLPYRPTAVLLVLLFLAAASALLAVGLAALGGELGALAGDLLRDQNAILSAVGNVFDRIGALAEKLPFLSDESGASLRASVKSAMLDILKNAVVGVSARLPSLVGRVAALIPQTLFSVLVTALSAVWLCADYDKITGFFKSRLAGTRLHALRTAYAQTLRTLASMARAYAILFLWTFAELWLGLALLRREYAFGAALFIALVDLLPVLGAGTVLIPLALYQLALGNGRLALGLAVLYAVITVARQLLEPHLVGAGIGMPPLLSLFCMDIGWRLFGVWGMLLLPVAVAVGIRTCRSLRQEKKEEKRT